MDTEHEILEELRQMSGAKVQTESQPSGAAQPSGVAEVAIAQLGSDRKSWRIFKRRNAAAWSAQAIAEAGAHLMKLGSGIRF